MNPLQKWTMPTLAGIALSFFLNPLLVQPQSSYEIDDVCLFEIARHRVFFLLKKEYQLNKDINNGNIGWSDIDSLMQAEGAVSVCHRPSDNPNYLSNRSYIFQFPLQKNVVSIVHKLEENEKVEWAIIDSVQTGTITLPAKLNIITTCEIDIGLCANLPTLAKKYSWGKIKRQAQ